MSDYLSKVRAIEGLEDFELEAPKMTFLKLMNGTKVLESGVPAGTWYVQKDADTIEIIEEAGKPLVFIPLKVYRDLSVWEDSNMIKKSLDFKTWSDGTPVLAHETEWQGDSPPVATEAANFVIIPVKELLSDTPRAMILAMSYSNKERRKAAVSMKAALADNLLKHEIFSMYKSVFQLDTCVAKGPKGSWIEFNKCTFVKLLAEERHELLASVFQEVKNINAVSNVREALPVYAAPKQLTQAEVTAKPAPQVATATIPAFEKTIEVNPNAVF